MAEPPLTKRGQPFGLAQIFSGSHKLNFVKLRFTAELFPYS
jgi:hypothetical protein